MHTSATIRILAAVILGMEVCSKLEAVVGATHQVPSAARVTIVLTTVTWPVTVTLSNVTRIVRSAASSAVIVPSTALFPWIMKIIENTNDRYALILTCWRFLPHPFWYLNHWSVLNSGRLLTAVILLMVEVTKLLAVI